MQIKSLPIKNFKNNKLCSFKDQEACTECQQMVFEEE